MISKNVFQILGFLLVSAMLLTGCGTAAAAASGSRSTPKDTTTATICGNSATTTSYRRSSGTKSPESFPSQTKRPAHPVLFRDAPVFHSHSTLTPSQRQGFSPSCHSSHTTPCSRSHPQTAESISSTNCSPSAVIRAAISASKG